MFPKRGRIKLNSADYYALKQLVLARDRWRCRRCGSRAMLQVHHLVERSDLRLDTQPNLCTLCAPCHERVTRNQVVVLGEDANQLLRFRDVTSAP